MAKNDSEPYVRATALKCLAVMIRIKSYWETSLCSMDLMVKTIIVAKIHNSNHILFFLDSFNIGFRDRK